MCWPVVNRAELRAITAATYHQRWWPAHDQLLYGGQRLPVWDTRAKAFTDPGTGRPLPTCERSAMAVGVGVTIDTLSR